MDVGTKRSPGIVILLCIVTLGVYWFYWNYKAFSEVAGKEQKPLRPAPWILPMVVLWLVGVGLTVTRTVRVFLERADAATPANPFTQQLTSLADPLFWAASAATTAFYVIQLFYHKQAHKIVEDACSAAGIPNVPNAALPLSFNILLAVSFVPFLGSIASFGGLVVAIVWVVQIQQAINAYWTRQVTPEAMPPAGWMTQPSMTSAAPPVRR